LRRFNDVGSAFIIEVECLPLCHKFRCWQVWQMFPPAPPGRSCWNGLIVRWRAVYSTVSYTEGGKLLLKLIGNKCPEEAVWTNGRWINTETWIKYVKMSRMRTEKSMQNFIGTLCRKRKTIWKNLRVDDRIMSNYMKQSPCEADSSLSKVKNCPRFVEILTL